jgi:hypothetical protein
VPLHRQTRFSALRLSTEDAGVAPGTYLVHLRVATWNGLRPLHEVWTATVDVDTQRVVADLGGRVMAAVASGTVQPARFDRSVDLDAAVQVSDEALMARHQASQATMIAENEAFLAARRLSVEQVHQRRLAALQTKIDTLLANGRAKKLPRFQGQQRRADERYAALMVDIDRRSTAMLGTEDLAVCVVEVR